MSTYTSEELLEGIRKALVARDMKAVAAMIHALAVVDPAAAEAILWAIDANKALR